jgi:hypothetical protein
MVPALIGLRAAIDRAIEVVGPLAGVLAAWEAAQEGPTAPEGTPRPPGEPASPGEASRPSESPSRPVGLFDELPARRPTNGSISAKTSCCERCGSAVEQQPRGARRRYCGAACRKAAKAERMAPVNGHGLLPDAIERPFAAIGAPDDPRSDPRLLRPPPIPGLA